mmetsp:Transcript_8616/g.18958  ORF Transcript_8616/g.18958 Transcript_8616/m.18958 type:complete len:85 (+) Transcript_8616:77-331(+)
MASSFSGNNTLTSDMQLDNGSIECQANNKDEGEEQILVIPFLRLLTDMLNENPEYITFCPGGKFKAVHLSVSSSFHLFLRWHNF